MKAGRPGPALAAAATVAVALLAGCGGKSVTVSTGAGVAPGHGPKLFAYDAGKPLDAVEGDVQSGNGVEVQTVAFKSFDGQTVDGVLAHPDSDGPFRCLIFQGGLEYSPSPGFFLTDPLLATRYEVLSIQPRFGGGQLADKVTAFAAQHDPSVLAQLIRYTVIDLRRGIDLLRSRPECEGDGIGYVGISFGGILGSLVAGADERITAPALIAAGGDWSKLLEGTDLILPGIEDSARRFDEALRILAPLDPDHWVAQISPRPVLMVSGRNDPTVVPPAARSLHAAANSPKQVLWYAGGHDPFTGPWADRVTSTLLGFLHANLGG
jgi:cephalosporin-C deacetylase-like acetyl esterase